MNEKKLEEWHFDFGLCASDPSQPIPESRCDELMDVIIEWAEKNELGVGGGFREFLEED
ncbi:hypothetical protein MNBD_GAMMA15-736 [hydrothermal vent metagenome]|uniref:Uncharacterized protein n=1 Tax=hydrothermal vent metagenome TaxID=652676 RepID=A0A3B0YBY1_9ZZZZ